MFLFSRVCCIFGLCENLGGRMESGVEEKKRGKEGE